LRSIAFVTFARRLAFAVAMVCVAALNPSLAAEPRPDFSIKTKWVEASVTLDAKIKADPALAANCQAEGKAWATKNRDDADKERKQEPELFRNPWSFERKYETRSVVDGRYVSIVRADYEYIPAARTPTARPTRSCGTGQGTNASASVLSSPKPPTTARR
jgi:hypothetical protein